MIASLYYYVSRTYTVLITPINYISIYSYLHQIYLHVCSCSFTQTLHVIETPSHIRARSQRVVVQGLPEGYRAKLPEWESLIFNFLVVLFGGSYLTSPCVLFPFGDNYPSPTKGDNEIHTLRGFVRIK